MKSIEIITETPDLIAVNKPAGLLSIPDRHDADSPSAVKLLRKQYPDVFVVHRLDKLTSGILLFAKNAAAHKYLSDLFQKRAIEKVYAGIVAGKMTEMTGRIDAPIAEHPFRKGEMMIQKKGKPSVTDFEVRKVFNQYSLVYFKPLTGRTHQIRVHAKHIHHPLACDPVYGDGQPVFLSSIKRHFRLGKNEVEERPLLSRLALHAQSLVFTDINGEHHHLEAPLPKDMRAVIQQLKKH